MWQEEWEGEMTVTDVPKDVNIDVEAFYRLWYI
jgi:hypothetical protein